MKDRSASAHVVRNQNTRLHTPRRILPVIIVPGIMGTRLTDPETGDLVWNPLGSPIGDSPGSFAVDMERLSQMSAELIPDETHPFDEEDKGKKADKVKHYYNLVWDCYGTFADELAGLNLADFDGADLQVKVYCCGYDWRQDNARSALRLAAIVDEALRETRERKVVIVAHSMGGLISRYYCRMLGGESKVHKLILVGSPTMGAPSAYIQLKHGLAGSYPEDLIRAGTEGRWGDLAQEIESSAGNAITAVGAWATGQGFAAGVKTLLGDVYAAMCIGNAINFKKPPTRAQMVYFGRQMPSLYQLLPTGVFCREFKNWCVFDPLATGHPPTGETVVFPTLLSATIDLTAGIANAVSSSAARAGDRFRESMTSFFDPGAAERTSPRAHLRMQTLEQKIETLVRGLQGGWVDWALAAIEIVKVFEQAGRMFLDCRDPRVMYRDIYTGVMDEVHLRSIGANNLALSLRFDDALTVNLRHEEPETPFRLVQQLMQPIVTALTPAFRTATGATGSFFGAVGHWLTSSEPPTPNGHPRWDYQLREQERTRNQNYRDARDAKARREEQRNPPKAYMHPRTRVVAGSGLMVDASCVLLPTSIYSNDDTNIVRWNLIPNYALQIAGLAAGSPTRMPTAHGDGTVPLESANPDEAMISHPLEAPASIVPRVSHATMCNNRDVIRAVREGFATIGTAVFRS